MKFKETKEYLLGIRKLGVKLNLERIEGLLERLGSPERGLSYVHIGGTNGKGSVAALVESALRTAGLSTGLYTSPHLVSMRERIRLNGEMISEEDFVSTFNRMLPHLSALPEHPTFFETLTAMAFLAFKEKSVDRAVLEVGLGGRLDATNVCNPSVTVITNVEIEHSRILGDTFEKIAREKAGIIKEGCSVVTGEAKEDPLRAIEEVCKNKGAPLIRLGRDFSYQRIAQDLSGQDVLVEGPRGKARLRIPLLGAHQAMNAAVAYAALKELPTRGIPITEPYIAEGFRNVSWPGRFETVGDLLIDCAHNPSGAKALREAYQGLFGDRKIPVILGVLKDKDVEGILKEVSQIAERFLLVKPPAERALEPEGLRAALSSLVPSIPSECFPSPETALEEARRAKNRQRHAALLTGSIFLAGEAMALVKRPGGE